MTMTDKERKQLNRFVKRTLLACLPLLAIVVTYIAIDPFNVIWSFNPMDKVAEKSEPFNRSRLAVEAYLNHRDSVDYNAFLFGSSRTIYYSVDEWKRHLPDDAVCFHFDAAWETLEGMLDKMDLIKEKGDRIKYAILEFHADQFADTAHAEIPYRQDFRLRHSENVFAYHFRHFMSALNTDFLKVYIPYLFTGKMEDTEENKVFESPMRGYDPVKNEIDYRNFDDEIDTDSTAYFNRYSRHYQKAAVDSVVPRMSDERIALLREMRRRLNADSTDYRVILGPSFYRHVNNSTDVALLRRIFGVKRVYDFQHLGVESQSNFYDNIHYRYFIADSIMTMVYGK